MTLEILRNFIQSSNINILYGSGISRPYLSTLGNIEKWLTKLAEDNSKEPYKEVIKASLYKAYCDGVILKINIFQILMPTSWKQSLLMRIFSAYVMS